MFPEIWRMMLFGLSLASLLLHYIPPFFLGGLEEEDEGDGNEEEEEEVLLEENPCIQQPAKQLGQIKLCYHWNIYELYESIPSFEEGTKSCRPV